MRTPYSFRTVDVHEIYDLLVDLCIPWKGEAVWFMCISQGMNVFGSIQKSWFNLYHIEFSLAITVGLCCLHKFQQFYDLSNVLQSNIHTIFNNVQSYVLFSLEKQIYVSKLHIIPRERLFVLLFCLWPLFIQELFNQRTNATLFN